MSYRTVNRWSTKADIVEDLAKVTGRFVDVDEQFIVTGEEPPPIRRCEDDDDEYNLRFSAADGAYEMQYENMPPDLKGISKMLRMMEEHEQTPESSVIRSPENKIEGVITISKLNPNVPEFVPKGAIESSLTIKNSCNSDNSVNDDVTSNKEKLDNIDSKNDNIIRIDKKIDISKLNAEEIKDITLKLKNKISNVSKKDDLHTKKEKNVAIAALLKLYTAPRADGAKEPIKLITPDFFATCPATDKKVRCQVHNVIVNSISSDNGSASKTSKDVDRASEKSAKNSRTSYSLEDDTSTQSGKTSPKSYIESPSEMKHYPHDPNVQKSIKKVTSWLSKPESPKPRGPVVCLGPISFKKKDVKSSVSDESSIKSNSSLNVQTYQIAHFVPSKLAEDLSKKYYERGRAIEIQSEDVWTKAMKQMKAIDDRKKLEQSTSQSDSRDDCSSGSSS